MANGYRIVRVDARVLDEYKRYMAAGAAPFARFGARFLVRGGKCGSVALGASMEDRR